MRTRWLLFALLAPLAGCGGEWVDVPEILIGCHELEDGSIPDLDEMFETMAGPGVCRERGGMDYAGEYRCEDGKVQVLCEES
jgi:hypothetical protein